MPILKIFTNIPKTKIPKDFLSKIIPVIADGVKKDADKFMCLVEGDCLLTIGGNSTLPAVSASLESIGNLGPKDNVRIARILSEFVQDSLSVSPSRLILTFYDLEPYNVAKEGTTVATLL